MSVSDMAAHVPQTFGENGHVAAAAVTVRGIIGCIDANKDKTPASWLSFV